MFEEQIAAFNQEQAAQENDRRGVAATEPGRPSAYEAAGAGGALASAGRDIHRMTYTVAEVQQMLGIGETSAYKLCNSGAFKVLRIGNSIRISRPSFDQWLEAQL